MNDNVTVLYVEDEPMVRENFQEILSRYFSNIISTDNGRDAIELYNTNPIDIAILDISIPYINGLNVAKKIRESSSTVEIIMLTAYSEKEKLLEAINLQLCSYLIKPVKYEELDATLNKAIKKVELQNTLLLSNNYSYNTKDRTLYYKQTVMKLSKNETKLVDFLCINKDAHYTSCDISTLVFQQDNTDPSVCNNVIQLISRFKKKMLKTNTDDDFFIDNIYGLGYKIKL